MLQIINTVSLVVTAAIIFWYTIETYLLRRESVRQTALQLRPYLIPSFVEDQARYTLKLRNVGNGTATNVRIAEHEIHFVDSDVRWKYEYSPIDSMEVGSTEKVQVWCNGERATVNILLAPQANALLINGKPAGSPWTLGIHFADVEGGKYLLEFDVVPSQRTENSAVVARPIVRLQPKPSLDQKNPWG